MPAQPNVIPTDRIAATPGEGGRRLAAIPIRYDQLNGQFIGWTYDIGSYVILGRPYQLGEVKITYSPIQTSGGKNSIYKDMLGIDDRTVQTQKATGDYSATQYMINSVLYNGRNLFSLGFVERQAERYSSVNGNTGDASYLTATAIDAAASIASIWVGGRIASGTASRLGNGLWGEVAGGATEAALTTIIQKEGEIPSYELTDPSKLNGNYAKEALTQFTLATVLGAGLPLLGPLMSGAGRSSAKVVWNSPNELNPTRYKIVMPTVSPKSSALLGSVADSSELGILNFAGGEIKVPSGLVFKLPATGSLTTQEALTWLSDISPSLKALLNPNAGLWEQAMQAVQLKNSFMVSARNGMADAHAALQLSMTVPTRTFDELLVMANKKGLFGNAAYKDVMTQAELEMKFRRTVEMPGGCFVAGTSVHTKGGLKPIEQIQVGDWVLSRPESGEGEPAYKQVTRTFSFEDKEVWTLEVCKREDVELRGSTEGLVSRIVATPNHPFWVIGKGWTALYHMAVGDNLITSDGKLVEIGHIEPLYKSRLSADLAFDLWTKNYSDIDGWLLNFSSEIDFQTDVPTKKLISGGGHFDLGLDYNSPESFYRTKVYNLEVDDFHTYCVGPLRVWVHNTNCEDVGGIGRAISQGLVPSNGAGFYQTIAEANAFTGTKKGLILVAENPRPGSLAGC